MHAPRTRPHSRRYRRLAALGVTGCALVIAGCGSSAPSSSTGTTSSYAQGIKYSDCMRSHGVPNYPDPAAGGGAPQPSSATNERSPAYQSAQKVCAHLHPGSDTPSPISAAQRTGMSAYARCIREHGVPNFPDPRFPPGDGVEVGVLPNEANSPALKQAVTTCEHVGIQLPGMGGA
jgi:hypothetical protein